jgi:hypothetical protein
MVGDGLITLERIDVVADRGGARERESSDGPPGR